MRPFPQDKYTSSMSGPEFAVRVSRMKSIGWPGLSDLQVRRARRVLVSGVTVRQLSEEDGVCRETLYRPIKAIARYTLKEPSR